MRDENLTGFVLHSRPYQEKRAIYTFFSRECGLIDGVSVRGLPLFCEMNLFAIGKNSLKAFKEPVLSNNTNIAITAPFLQYACLYLNELIYRLFAKEDDMGVLYDSYKQALLAIKNLHSQNKQNQDKLSQNQDKLSQKPPKTDLTQKIKPILRQFERVLFDVLGVSFDFDKDHLGQKFVANGVYGFKLEQGFVRVFDKFDTGILTGQQITQMGQSVANLDKDLLNKLAILHKMLIDFLLEYKPLNSRKLWQDHQRLVNIQSH